MADEILQMLEVTILLSQLNILMTLAVHLNAELKQVNAFVPIYYLILEFNLDEWSILVI